MSSKIKFVTSAVNPSGWPVDKRPEVAIIGRSNAGKSSFINAISNSKIAKTSSTPGKTRLLNFFDIGEKYRLVDMPGYGFASRSGGEVYDWKDMIESYINERSNLRGLILIMDIRRDWQAEEQQMVDWMVYRSLPILVILNKKDKAKKNEIANKRRIMKQKADVPEIFTISCLNRDGALEAEDFVFRNWIKEL